jgi:hypothetical protein
MWSDVRDSQDIALITHDHPPIADPQLQMPQDQAGPCSLHPRGDAPWIGPLRPDGRSRIAASNTCLTRSPHSDQEERIHRGAAMSDHLPIRVIAQAGGDLSGPDGACPTCPCPRRMTVGPRPGGCPRTETATPSATRPRWSRPSRRRIDSFTAWICRRSRAYGPAPGPSASATCCSTSGSWDSRRCASRHSAPMVAPRSSTASTTATRGPSSNSMAPSGRKPGGLLSYFDGPDLIRVFSLQHRPDEGGAPGWGEISYADWRDGSLFAPLTEVFLLTDGGTYRSGAGEALFQVGAMDAGIATEPFLLQAGGGPRDFLLFHAGDAPARIDRIEDFGDRDGFIIYHAPTVAEANGALGEHLIGGYHPRLQLVLDGDGSGVVLDQISWSVRGLRAFEVERFATHALLHAGADDVPGAEVTVRLDGDHADALFVVGFGGVSPPARRRQRGVRRVLRRARPVHRRRTRGRHAALGAGQHRRRPGEPLSQPPDPLWRQPGNGGRQRAPDGRVRRRARDHRHQQRLPDRGTDRRGGSRRDPPPARGCPELLSRARERGRAPDHHAVGGHRRARHRA